LKLLLDQNLSRKLVPALNTSFPGSSHVIYVDLDTATDFEIWQFARANGFTLVTKNTDMVDLCLVKGDPPKVLWLRVGNCATSVIQQLFEVNVERIRRFERADSQVVLSLFRFASVE
jgi:predicted nuclease of predicted toxin-antitoxin system